MHIESGVKLPADISITAMCSMFSGTSGHQTAFWPPRGRLHTTVLTPLEKLRKLFIKHRISAYIVPTSDAHNSEIPADSDKRRAFITGFTGSAGIAIIGTDFAELSTDGRYFLQAEQQLGPEWTLRKQAQDEPWETALLKRCKASKSFRVGVDPTVISYAEATALKDMGIDLLPISENLIDTVWVDRPKDPINQAIALPDSITGEGYQSKIQRVREALDLHESDAIVISALDEIAWLFNIRGGDIPFSPVIKAYAIITQSSTRLYIESKKLKNITLSGVEIKPYAAITDDLVGEHSKLWVPDGSSMALMHAAKNPSYGGMSPVAKFKSIKTKQEIQGARSAQLKCGISFVRLFNWLEHHIDHEDISEWDSAQKLLKFREELEDFMGLSYESISSVGANAAIIHYSPAPDSKFIISRKEPYLLDAGCHFLHGTTDTTRTVHFGTPSTEVKKAYTLVLKGHIALSMAVFPANTTGGDLDVLARQFLWQFGLNYRHGTGHGVGSFLNVHEPPAGFGRAGYDKFGFQDGVLVTNEPGCYFDHKFGVRVESLLLAQKAQTPYQFDGVQYYEFEYITVVPLALNMIDKSLMTLEEIKWVNAYSSHVNKVLSPHLNAQEKTWLDTNTHSI